MPSAIELVLAERNRQISAEGYSHEHDDRHETGEIAHAAGCYSLHAGYQCALGDPAEDFIYKNGQPVAWPWTNEEWKPSKDRIRNLIKACALNLAEIERLQRLQAKEGPKQEMAA